MPIKHTGTFTQNTEGQPKCCIKKPPTAGPAKEPSATTAPIPPKARPRVFPLKALAIIAWEFAIMAEEPNPCSARAKTINGKLPASEHNTDPTPNSANPPKYIFLRLYISLNLPKTGKKQVTASR